MMDTATYRGCPYSVVAIFGIKEQLWGGTSRKGAKSQTFYRCGISIYRRGDKTPDDIT